MAILSPSLLPSIRSDAGRFRELEVLERLRDYLPAHFEVFHSVGLHTLHAEQDFYGEIDIAVLSPDGGLLLIEIKSGPVVLREGEIFKMYSNGPSDVSRQTRMQRAAMQNRLQEAGLHTRVLSCLVLPDYDIGDSQVISIPRERIIDATRYGEMVSLVQQWLGEAPSNVDRPALRRLLLNQFRVTPRMDVLRHQLQGTVRQLSDGLATWVPRIEAPSGVVRVQATAGSGKTQLAIQLLEGATEARTTAAYVCFNRSLADFVRQIAPTRAEVVHFHELCVEHHRRLHGEPKFDSDGFEQMAQAYLAASETFTPRFDLIVIDEAQDFNPDWVESLCNQLKPGGKLYVLEDENQRLYEQADFELGESVQIRCRDNFRSPRAICDMINGLALAPAIRSMNPYQGELPEVRTYATEEQLLAETEAAVRALLHRGFELADIVVITGRGRSNSTLLNVAQIGPWETRRWTGEYDRNGDPRWTSGEILVESVYRYKGQSAPAIVVAEFDFTTLDERARRKLFVALTRAQMAAALVLSTSAERCLAEVLVAAS